MLRLSPVWLVILAIQYRIQANISNGPDHSEGSDTSVPSQTSAPPQTSARPPPSQPAHTFISFTGNKDAKYTNTNGSKFAVTNINTYTGYNLQTQPHLSKNATNQHILPHQESGKSHTDPVAMETIYNQQNMSLSNLPHLLNALCGYDMRCTGGENNLVQLDNPVCCAVCSCDITTCQISNNCCPNVTSHAIQPEPDPAPTCRALQHEFATMIKTRQYTVTVKKPTQMANHKMIHNNPSLETSQIHINNCTTNTKITAKCRAYHSMNPMEASTTHISDTKQSFVIWDSDHFEREYLVIDSCPSSYDDDHIRAECSRDSSNHLIHYMPFSEWSGSVTYKNIFCAHCNNASITTSWLVHTNCTQLFTSMFPTRVEELSYLMNNCALTITPQTFALTDANVCQTDHIKDLIKSCNVTGQWKDHDQYIEDMCLKNSTIGIYEYVDEPHGIYRNVFCYLCNTDMIHEHHHKCSKKSLPEQQLLNDLRSPPTFHASLDVTLPILCGGPDQTFCSHTNSENKTCPGNLFHDQYTDKCRQLVCPLSSNPAVVLCVLRNDAVTGLTLTGRLLFTSEHQYICGAQDHTPCNDGFFQAVYNDFVRTLEITSFHCIPASVEVFYNTSDEGTRKFYMILKLVNNYKCPVQKLLNIFHILEREPILINQSKAIYSQMVFNAIQADAFTDHVSLVNGTTHDDVLLNASFHCPRVILSLEDYQHYVKKNFIMPIDEAILDQQYTQDTGNVEICISHFFANTLNKKPSEKQGKNLDMAISLTVISSFISILSTLFIILTYGIFSELQFLPGKLLMVLCVNLLFAQLFFVFGMKLGVNSVWCKIVGGCIHLFWLATVYSMNCSLSLMVQNFNSPLQEDNRMLMQSKSNIKVVKSFTSCYCIPLLSVLVNIIVSSLQTPPSCGYGGDLCYISTPKMRLYTFALPLGLVVIVNLGMFVFIMMKICKVLHGYSTACVKQIVIFCKLSTMTGMFWTFGFLYEATNIELFNYAYIVLNAGHGFFLMWSFLFNTRVLEMYRQLFHRYFRKLNSEWTLSGTIREFDIKIRKKTGTQSPTNQYVTTTH